MSYKLSLITLAPIPLLPIILIALAQTKLAYLVLCFCLVVRFFTSPLNFLYYCCLVDTIVSNKSQGLEFICSRYC